LRLSRDRPEDPDVKEAAQKLASSSDPASRKLERLARNPKKRKPEELDEQPKPKKKKTTYTAQDTSGWYVALLDKKQGRTTGICNIHILEERRPGMPHTAAGDRFVMVEDVQDVLGPVAFGVAGKLSSSTKEKLWMRSNIRYYGSAISVSQFNDISSALGLGISIQ